MGLKKIYAHLNKHYIIVTVIAIYTHTIFARLCIRRAPLGSCNIEYFLDTFCWGQFFNFHCNFEERPHHLEACFVANEDLATRDPKLSQVVFVFQKPMILHVFFSCWVD